jgi:hypothetical protein
MDVSKEYWWNNNNRGKLKYSEKYPSQFHKSHLDWPGTACLLRNMTGATRITCIKMFFI